ncbi:hypothetical protein CBP05_08685 [Pseudomonas putida]|nr:hypothetical protein CBP05_08685 [Pseudomonas putida]OUS89601.1 hypothetical protein CBP06_07260 [Pseudomonas putida]
MQRQNVEQAEQLVAEVLVAACLAAAADEGSAKERRVVRELLHCAFDTLCARRISVHAQVGGGKSSCPVPRTEASSKSNQRNF